MDALIEEFHPTVSYRCLASQRLALFYKIGAVY